MSSDCPSRDVPMSESEEEEEEDACEEGEIDEHATTSPSSCSKPTSPERARIINEDDKISTLTPW